MLRMRSLHYFVDRVFVTPSRGDKARTRLARAAKSSKIFRTMLLSRCLYTLSLLLMIYAVVIPIFFQPIGKWKGVYPCKLLPYTTAVILPRKSARISDAVVSWSFILLQVVLHPQGLNITRFFSGRAKVSRKYLFDFFRTLHLK